MAFEGNLSNKNAEKPALDIENLSSSYETFIAFRELLEANGFVMHKNINDAYRQLGDTSFIVRREDPRQIISLLGPDGKYEVRYVGDNPYSNCVEWNPRVNGNLGIENAYFEGFTDLNNVVSVIGFEKNEQTSLQRLPDATQNFYGLNRHLVRSFSGPVEKENVRFVNLRIPAHLLPESELTEDELDKLFERTEKAQNGTPTEPLMIHRSFINNIYEEEEIKKAA